MADLKAANAAPAEVAAAEKALGAMPKDEAKRQEGVDRRAGPPTRPRPRRLPGMPNHAQIYAGDPNGDAAAQKAFDESRRNFLALVFCLMVGMAALPHILMRYYTTPSVKQARESVT